MFTYWSASLHDARAQVMTAWLNSSDPHRQAKSTPQPVAGMLSTKQGSWWADGLAESVEGDKKGERTAQAGIWVMSWAAAREAKRARTVVLNCMVMDGVVSGGDEVLRWFLGVV